MEPRNQWEFRCLGLKRSGHHAIILWLANHFPPRSVHFINDVVPSLNPFRFHSNTAPTTSRSRSFVHRPEQDIISEQLVRKHCLMYNYEDRPLHQIHNALADNRRVQHVGHSARVFTVIVLRDPFNLAASRFRCRFRGRPALISKTLDSWMEYADEFAGVTNLLGPKLLVNFNRWFASEEYRRELSATIGLTFNDSGLNRVVGNGAGSSWDGTHFDNRAQDMKVLERWKCLVSNTNFRRIFRGRSDVAERSAQLFGPMPGTELLFTSAEGKAPRLQPRLRSLSAASANAIGV